ncbi:IS4 family transposase [Paenibacillus sp. GCM10012303]|uniref:IS4 family transposase n=1 Tax=Paenibacillus sp. GCM10012303 TaxID=3317340 RepID=UPI00361DF621
MDSISNSNVLSKYLSFLHLDEYDLSVFDRYKQKLKTADCIRLFIVAHLMGYKSSRDIEKAVRAEKSLQVWVQADSISHSQLTRKLPQIPTEILEHLLVGMVKRIQDLSPSRPGILKSGKLGIVDSTTLSIPAGLGEWAYVSKHQTMVKMHLRLVVESPDTLVPEAIIPTTGNVSDHTVATQLLIAKEVLYVLDRGYVKYARLDEWAEAGFHYVIRINEKHVATVLESYAIPPNSRIVRDARVRMGSSFASMKQEVRLVEYHDEKGRLYRVVTTRFDLSAEEIAEIYRKRWIIELFFKWLKQREALVKLYSYKPQAVWNTMYLCLLAYCLMLLVKLTDLSTLPNREVWRTLQHFAYKSWTVCHAELHRKPTRRSKGRQPSKEEQEPASLQTTVGVYKPSEKK